MIEHTYIEEGRPNHYIREDGMIMVTRPGQTPEELEAEVEADAKAAADRTRAAADPPASDSKGEVKDDLRKQVADLSKRLEAIETPRRWPWSRTKPDEG